MTLTLRPLTRADVPAWAALLAAAETADRTGEHYSEDDLVEEMADPALDPARDLVGAVDPAGDLVGYYAIHPRSSDGTVLEVAVEGVVAPQRRGEGVGTLLARGMVDRAREVRRERGLAEPVRVTAWGPDDNPAQADLYASVGLHADRWNIVMAADLRALDLGRAAGAARGGSAGDEPRLPEGYRLRPYEAALDLALFEAHNEAFLDHPGFTPWTREMWAQWVSGSRNFRPALTYVVVEESAPDVVVAYVQSNEFDAHQEATGDRQAFVAKVGCRRDHRGRGLAGTVLRHCLRRYHDEGYDEAALDVDSENPSGALGLYEKAGFEVRTRHVDYVGTFSD